jgi:hypothetical protein
MITIEQMVQREVCLCVSSLVSTLAQGYDNGSTIGKSDLYSLTEQAMELASPIPDYEEAATQAGYREYDGVWINESDEDAKTYRDVEALCNCEDIEPYDREVYEFWAVSNWLAEKLESQGEKVDTDFAGMNVWARTCTGQGIASDGVIERIHAALIAA